MESLLINNIFMGLKDSVNLFEGQSVCNEGDGDIFLNILSNITSSVPLGDDAAGTTDGAVMQQMCMQDVSLLNLIQNISNVNVPKWKDAGAAGDDSLRHPSVEKRDDDAGDDDAVEVDLTGTDIDSIGAVLLLLNSISQALSKDGMNPYMVKDISEIVVDDIHSNTEVSGGFHGDRIFIAENNMAESVRSEDDLRSLSDQLIETKTKKETVGIVPQQLAGNVSSIPVINNIYFSQGQFEGKKVRDNGADISFSEEKIPAEYFMPGAANTENNTCSIPSGSTRVQISNDMNNDTGNTVKIISSNVAYITKQVKNDNKDILLPEYQKAGLDVSEEDTVQVLSAHDKGIFDEFTMNQKRDDLKPQVYVMKQGNIESKEQSFKTSPANNQKAGLIADDVAGKEDTVQPLSACNKSILLDESTMNQKGDNLQPKVGDLEILPKDNNGYLSYLNQDDFDGVVVRGSQGDRSARGTSFSSAMIDRISKIAEQYAAKGTSMDMIVRLKINDSDTMLVGLRNEGQRVMVDVKTTNGELINMLQTNKYDIMRNLEGKNVYTNIFVDPDGGSNYEQRDERKEDQRGAGKRGKKDFADFLEAV